MLELIPAAPLLSKGGGERGPDCLGVTECGEDPESGEDGDCGGGEGTDGEGPRGGESLD